MLTTFSPFPPQMRGRVEWGGPCVMQDGVWVRVAVLLVPHCRAEGWHGSPENFRTFDRLRNPLSPLGWVWVIILVAIRVL